MKHLKDLNDTEKREFINSFDYIFCDCDGVIWYDLHKLIPGSGDAINYLQELGKKIIYVTNNNIITAEEQLRKLQQISKVCEEKDLIHPARVIADYLDMNNFDGMLMCCASDIFKDYMKKRGYRLSSMPEKFIGHDLLDLRNAIYSSDPVKAVIIDVDFNLTPWKIIRAQMHLKDPNCLFIGGAADPLIPLANMNVLGPGVFINLLAESSGRTPIIMGKPGHGLRDYLKSKFNISDSKRVLFIGDSMKTDVAFGHLCGYQTLLVLSGAVTVNDLNKPLKCNEHAPDYVINSLNDLTNLIH